MKTKKPEELKDGDQCAVIAGTHAGKSGTVQDVNTSKTGHITITVVQKNGVRFKTLGKNVSVQTALPAGKKSKLADIKTKQNTASVDDFINKEKDEQKRKDSFTLLEMMKKVTGEEPRMWGASLIGFGNMRFKSPNTGREVDWFVVGFSPRKANLSIYLGLNVQDNAAALKKLGKHKTGVGCLYIHKLSDIDPKILKEMVAATVKAKRGEKKK